MKKNIFLFLMATIMLTSCKDEHSELKDGIYAIIETDKGEIILELEYKKAPITVANFVSLAEGKNTFVNEKFKGKPFFDGLKFHRVIPDFMIQGGDPEGNGSGDTGYKFKDEIVPELQFDKGGILAMANSGPATNSSQFFITHIETPWLNGKHTIFGQVVGDGMKVVNQINQDDAIKSIKILKKGAEAKKFNAVKIFNNFFKNEQENLVKQQKIDAELKSVVDAKYKVVKEQKVASLQEFYKTAIQTPSGLKYKITAKGKGKKPANGQNIFIHYAGFLENGDLFDTSIENVAQTFGTFNAQRAAAQQYLPIPFQAGKKDGMIPGFIEGLEKLSFGDKAVLFIPSNLAYGAQGAGDVIPPNANIIFEVELLESLPKH